jgi:hypothetical protein
MRPMAAPEAYVEWINTHLGFNPRSQFASNALSDFVVADLRAGCPVLNQAFDSGLLVPQKNIAVKTKVVERNIDLVIRETAGQQLGTSPVAIEHKTIMTAHGKARKNRYGDIIAYSNHMHNHRRDCRGRRLSSSIRHWPMQTRMLSRRTWSAQGEIWSELLGIRLLSLPVYRCANRQMIRATSPRR